MFVVARMSVKLGFDFYPPLDAANESDKTKWNEFLDKIESVYGSDSRYESTSDRITFKIGNDATPHPYLPRNGLQFRRFSTQIAGYGDEAQDYVVSVFEIVKMFFTGMRVFYWSEFGFEDEPKPKYSDEEVQKAMQASA